MKASERPRCALCSQAVFVKDSAWISHHHGFTVHWDCLEGSPGWYREILERRTA